MRLRHRLLLLTDSIKVWTQAPSAALAGAAVQLNAQPILTAQALEATPLYIMGLALPAPGETDMQACLQGPFESHSSFSLRCSRLTCPAGLTAPVQLGGLECISLSPAPIWRA